MDQGVRHLEFDRLCNFRDLGGYRTVDGRTIHWGQLYRSDSLGKLQDRDWERFLALGVRTVIDLRYPVEIERRGRVPEYDGLAYHNLSIEHRPYNQAKLGADVDVATYLAERYAEVVFDGVAEIGRALIVIADGEAPVVFHCAAGKDRTGIIAALVLSLLGVPEDVIIDDFALTNRATPHLVAYWTERHGPPAWPGYGQAPAELMRLFLKGLTDGYGSPRGYVTDRLGLSEDLIARMRERYLTTG